MTLPSLEEELESRVCKARNLYRFSKKYMALKILQESYLIEKRLILDCNISGLDNLLLFIRPEIFKKIVEE
jgi:hypothetical protein